MQGAGALGELELRRAGDGSVRLSGVFPYGKPAVLSDGGRGGRPVKEMIARGAFNYTIEEPATDIHFLAGHDFGKVLASKLSGTLSFRDTAAALLVTATITPAILRAQYAADAVAQVEAGLATGLSPGFRLPPERAVPREQAETTEDEPDDGALSPLDGKPQRGAIIRTIRQAILVEMSLVVRPAYPAATVEARELVQAVPALSPRLRWRA